MLRGPAKVVEEARGRGVGTGWQRAAVESGAEPLRKGLAELDPPLIEGVDVPQDPLHEDPVLVEGEQPAESTGVEAAVGNGD